MLKAKRNKIFYSAVFVSLLCVGVVRGQQSMDLGFSTGITNYYGDLGNGDFMQASSSNPGFAITARNLISPSPLRGNQYTSFNVEARISWNRIAYDETNQLRSMNVKELQNYNRGLGFRNDIFGFSSHVTYTYYPNKKAPLHRQSLALFVFTGVGIYHSNPKADLFNGSIDINNRYYFWNDGTTRNGPRGSADAVVIEKDGDYETSLKDWITESRGLSTESENDYKDFKPWNLGIPLGFGFRYGINKKLTLSFEAGYYQLLNDYIDDVSDNYATYEELDRYYAHDPIKLEIAKYISDPTGLGTDGTTGPFTSRRGNPGLKDAYSYINIEIAYRFEWNPKKLVSWLQ